MLDFNGTVGLPRLKLKGSYLHWDFYKEGVWWIVLVSIVVPLVALWILAKCFAEMFSTLISFLMYPLKNRNASSSIQEPYRVVIVTETAPLLPKNIVVAK
jgi:hypothetical protein